VKTDISVTVVLGNPPYSVSSQNASKRKRILNQDEKYLADVKYTGLVWEKEYKTGKAGKTITEVTHIGEILELYKGRVRLEGEKNIQPLDDDYIKFIRFAQYQVENNSHNAGIIGFITNHSYINGLIHRGMREELLKYFDTLYIMDLHGNSLLKETAPDGSVDENVFDIQQGVAILIAVREKSKPDMGSTAYKPRNGVKELAKVFYHDLWGSRENKYNFLSSASLDSVNWIEVTPTAPNYFFAPKNFDLAAEYNQLTPITDIFLLYKNGIQSGHDAFATAYSKKEVETRVKDFYSSSITNNEIQNNYQLTDKAGWILSTERKNAFTEGYNTDLVKQYFYRLFDDRWIYFSKRILKRPVK